MIDKKVYVVFDHYYNKAIGVYEKKYDAYDAALNKNYNYMEPGDFSDLQAELQDGNFLVLDESFEELDCYAQVHETTLND